MNQPIAWLDKIEWPGGEIHFAHVPYPLEVVHCTPELLTRLLNMGLKSGDIVVDGQCRRVDR